MIILGHYKLLINSELLTALLPIFGGRAAMWVNFVESDFDVEIARPKMVIIRL